MALEAGSSNRSREEGAERVRDQQQSGGCPTHLLDDEPAVADELFPSDRIGPHTRIAAAIAALIRSNERGGKVIGIEGGWGAGKTTVVGLLNEHFQNDDYTSLTTFDAWAHRGDPLRRTFLEALVAHLRAIEWLSDSLWDGKRGWNARIEALAKRRREWTTTTIPKTTALGTAFAVSALLVPLGVILVDSSLEHGITLGTHLPIAWSFIVGLPLALAPLALAAFYYLFERATGRTPSWALLTGNAIVEQNAAETDAPEPTSLEFERLFEQLVNDGLTPDSRRRLVIVLDNLDRVDAQDALAIWATLQTFTKFGHRPGPSSVSQLWLVVPYDSDGLRALWRPTALTVENTGAHSKSSEREHPQQKTADGPFAGGDVAHKVAESFIDKSFQIRFELPPPVLSNWRAYLKKLVVRALPMHAEEGDELCRVYSATMQNHHPTPRELKIFVNQIGMIHRQWPDHTFPLAHVAYYVLLKRRHLDVPDAVINIPEPQVLSLVSSHPQGLQESLAGLAFNVEPALGIELVLKDRILSALGSGEPQAVDALANGNPAGFWALLDDTSNAEIRSASAGYLKGVIRCVVASPILTAERNSRARVLFDCVAKRIGDRDLAWDGVDRADGEMLGRFVKILGDTDYGELVADSIRRTADRGSGSEPQLSQHLLAAIAAFVAEVRDTEHRRILNAPFPVVCSPEQWVASAEALMALDDRSDERTFWSYLQPSPGSDAILEVIARAIADAKADANLVRAVSITQDAKAQPDWAAVVAACRTWLDFATNGNGGAVGDVLEILMRLRDKGGKQALHELAVDGHILHAWHHKQTRRNGNAVIRCLVALMYATPDLAQPEQLVGSQSDTGFASLVEYLQMPEDRRRDHAEALVDALMDFLDLDVLFATLAHRGLADPLLASALLVVLGDESTAAKVPTILVMKHWQALRDLVEAAEGGGFVTLLSSVGTREDFVDDLRRLGFTPASVELYQVLLDAKLGDAFVGWCREALAQLSMSDWTAALRGENALLDLCVMLSRMPTCQMPHRYRDALVELAKQVMQGQTRPPEHLSALRPDIVNLMAENEKADFRVRCAKDMLDHDGPIEPAFWDLFGEHMLAPERFRNDQSMAELFRRLVTARDVGGLAWLERLLMADPTLADSVSPEISSVFRDRLRESIAVDGSGVAGERLVGIARQLGIEIDEPSDAASSSSA
jgi:hypothetical protein